MPILMDTVDVRIQLGAIMSTESIQTSAAAVPLSAQDAIARASSPPTVTDLAVYLRELPRLLEEGHAGRYALIMGDEVISIWDTQTDVLQAGYERFDIGAFTVKKIDPRDPARVAAILAREKSACPSCGAPSKPMGPIGEK
jgi:hypothetical protein